MSPPFLSARLKYASTSYISCASHALSFFFISVSGFIEIYILPFLVIEQTRHCMKNNQREITPKIQARVIILKHDTLSHCVL